MEHRVQKLIAEAGIVSRRKAEALIEQGHVTVNGKTITVGDKATYDDTITVDGKKINFQKFVYYMLHKPAEYECTHDENKKNVFQLVPNSPGLKYIGRLDKDTTGLLLFTNDGNFVQKIAHPSNNISKTYTALLNKPLQQKHLRQLQGTYRMKEDEVRNIKTTTMNNTVTITLHSGQKHIVKHIFASLGYTVKQLQRTHIGQLSLGTLKQGECKPLTTTDKEKIFGKV